MIKRWLLIFLFPSLLLTAQNNDGHQSAIELHQEGLTLITKEQPTLLEQLQGLEKFLKSHNTPGADTLQLKNEIHIRSLFNIFAHYQDPDSLIKTTRFFPDSIFQTNSKYSATSKSLIKELLTRHRQEKRYAYLKIRDLKYPSSLVQESEVNRIITFEKYWSLEVLQFEKRLAALEQQWRNYPIKAREELLELHLQAQLEKLQNQEQEQNATSNTKMLLEQIEKGKEKIEAANSNYQQFKKIGYGIFGTLLLLGYFLWKRNDKLLKSNNQSLLEEKKRSEDLLTNILPPEVVRELKRKGAVKAQQYEEISVFFSDFKNFSQIAETLSPEELVQELDYCFTAFDRIIDKYRLQKIKTLGDAYMCVGGLYTRGNLHVFRMVDAALEIQQFLVDRKKERMENKDYFFEARIGIHTGPIVAGVIGSKKIAFDIWGDTVNVAQQMEQHSEADKVNISGETYQIIKEQFDCTHRGTITAKNQQEFDMYFVDKYSVK